MHHKHFPIWLAAALAVSGCSSMENQIRSSGPMGQTDADYVAAASQIVQLDQQGGKLATTNAADPRVVDLSNQLVSQATILSPQLQVAARTVGVLAPGNLPSNMTAEINQLHGLNGPAFDHQYVADELVAHQQAVAIFKKEDATTKDGAMRTMVETALPTVQNNLAKLQYLSNDINPAHG
jgi:putative membrane protein